MSLTGIPLILLAACATAGALGATVLVWCRWGRWRHLARPAGVLLVEALLIFTVGLAVNRSQQFYPSWAALFAPSDPAAETYHTAAGRLDNWLATQPSAGGTQSFPWAPPGYEGWHLAAPPTVTVPAGYLQHPGWRYSAVLVLARQADAWPPPSVTGATVLVEAVTTSATPAAALATTVPVELDRDLRVTGHRWATVTSAGDNLLARQVVSAARGRYPSVAFVGVAAPSTKAVSPPAAKKPAKTPARKPAKKPAKTSAKTKPKPTTGTPPPGGVIVLPPGALPSGIQAAYFPAEPKTPRALAGLLTEAVAWAAAQTPPPLAASAPEPTYLPIPTKSAPSGAPVIHKAHPRARRPGKPVLPQQSPTPHGGPDGSGQPRP